MKTKFTITKFYLVLFALMLFISGKSAFSQNNSINNGNGKLWEKNQNTGNIFNTGLTNYVGIGTENPTSPLEVHGKVLADSIQVNNYIVADSMHVRSLRVGDNSLWIGGTGPWTPGGWGGTDMIASDNGQIGFFNWPMNTLQDIDNISVAIGGLPLQKLSINDFDFNPVYTSFSNLATNSGPFTLPLVTDGFLVGIAADGTAELMQQENRAIRIFTNNGADNEQRMIISHDATTNVPRVGIGMNNLLEPRTFLHIGQDINETGLGYRDWMDVGALVVGEKSNNMYFGFSETDHILNWGSELSMQNQNRIRFINSSGDVAVQSGSQDGLEIARMVSDGTTGRMGIGDFFTIAEDPTQVLDVIGNARLRDLPLLPEFHDETLTRCVVVDDDGVLHWRSFDGSGTGGSLGNICAGPTSNPLLNDWEIPLNNQNFVFSGQGAFGTNSVGIGIPDCQPTAKLDVLINTGELQSVGIRGTSSLSTGQIGIEGNALDGAKQIGVRGYALDCGEGSHSCGVQGDAISNTILEATYNFGGHFFARNGNVNIGVFGRGASTGLAERNYGSKFSADNAETNYAGYFEAPSEDPNSVHNFGVYAICPPNPDDLGVEFNWAGYFVGSVHVEGNITYTGNCNDVSDQQFKQDVHDYAGGIDAIRDLRPVNFYFDTVNYDLNFPTDMQYGLIAQEVEPILPNLVSNQMIPEKFDTAGNVISESIQYKGLDYVQITPILIQAVKELDENISVLLKMPEVPVLIEPQNNINVKYGTKLEFKWHKSENTQYYIFELAYDPGMTDTYYSYNINDTTTKVLFTLTTDTTIYWAVRAVNSYAESDYSEVRSLNYMAGFVKSTSQSYAELSDINMKTDIVHIEDALAKTMTLQGVSFSWDTINNPNRNLSEGTHLGLIAQEVQPVFPEVVSTDANGYLYIDYSSLVPVLIESVKDLKYINDSLNQRLNDMETRIDNIEQFLNDDLGDVQMKNSNNPAFQQEVTLENTKAIVLNQNVPNPFKEQTTISFQIPDIISSAKIVFIDNLGNILKQVEINDRGYGELIVYAHDLSAGHYTYYLVADGNTIKSKRMVLTR